MSMGIRLCSKDWSKHNMRKSSKSYGYTLQELMLVITLVLIYGGGLYLFLRLVFALIHFLEK